MKKYWDISLSLSPDMPIWPGDPPIVLKRIQDMKKGATVNITTISCSVHAGTHLDAPLHFISNGRGVDELSFDALIGKTRVIQLPKGVKEIGPEELERELGEDPCERVLFKTANSALWKKPDHPFQESFVAFTEAGAGWLASHRIKLVGIDYLSVQLYRDQSPTTHQTLLRAGIVLLEGLNLRDVQPGTYRLICLPIKLADCEGAPARAILTCEVDE